MSVPDIDEDGLQQSGGAPQTLTEAGMEAWLTSVDAVTRACARGKKRLFQSSREDLIRTSRRRV
jgi:hypothetical protein